jgi:hypothetical protein
MDCSDCPLLELFCKLSFQLGWLIGAPPLVSSPLCLGISTEMKVLAGSKIALFAARRVPIRQ